MLIEGQNISSIRYLDPLTKDVYRNFTIAACKLLYQNVFKLEEASFQQFKALYQLPMNSNSNVSAQNLHRRFFFTSDIKQKQIARTIRHNSKGIISQEAIRDSDGKYSHENFIN